jgi:hypothetical protein
MTDQNSETRRQTLLSAFKRTGVSFFWKLVIVAAGVGGYFALNAMEQSKSNFDKANTDSVVIVDRPENDWQDIIELPANDVSAMFDNYVDTKVEANKKLVDDLKLYVNRVKYQPVQNSDELLDRMNQEILKDEAAAERDSEQQLDFLEKQFAARKASLFEKCALPVEPIPASATVANHAENKKVSVVRPCPQSLPRNPTCAQVTNQFACWKDNYEAQRRTLTNRDSQVKIHEARMKGVYEHLRPKLIARVDSEKGQRKVDSFAVLFPSKVLDEKNGIHVIFSIFWLTCMVILVFGVLFVILFLLRPLPPFAGGVEALSEQTKDLLARPSATPAVAKSVLFTVTALGIGTAVAVSGGMNMPGSNKRSNLELVNSRYTNGPGDQFGENSKPQRPQIINVAAPPISPPSVTVNVPSSDNAKLDRLSQSFAQLDSNVRTLTGNLNTLKSGVDNTLSHIDSAMDQKVQPIGSRLVLVGDEVASTKSELQAFKAEAATLKNDFLTRIDGLNTSFQDFRNEDLSQVRIPGNRDFFSKTASIFSWDKERYLVTTQSYLALKRLMCVKTVSDRQTASCTLNATCDCEKNELVEKLRSLIGKKPMTKSQLFDELKGADVESWKSIILRYTRVV